MFRGKSIQSNILEHSCILKVLERTILRELEDVELVEKPLNRNQHAFRKGSSCDSALSDMVNDIEKSIHRGEYALGVFLDITGAFSNLSLDSAETGMTKALFRPEIRKWYAHYMKNMRIFADVKGCKSARKSRRGTPQGGGAQPSDLECSI